jgi:hypothetical protein
MSKQSNRKRGVSITIQHERELLRQRMAQANTQNLNEYIITCVLLGAFYTVNLDDFIEVRRLMSITSTNIYHRANATIR